MGRRADPPLALAVHARGGLRGRGGRSRRSRPTRPAGGRRRRARRPTPRSPTSSATSCARSSSTPCSPARRVPSRSPTSSPASTTSSCAVTRTCSARSARRWRARRRPTTSCTTGSRSRSSEKATESLVEGITPGLPSLLYAHKLFRKAASVGLDPGTLDDAARPDRRRRRPPAVRSRPEAALADLLAGAVVAARARGVDAESVLRGWSARFRERFVRAEDLAAEQGTHLGALDAAGVAALWLEAAPVPHPAPPPPRRPEPRSAGLNRRSGHVLLPHGGRDVTGTDKFVTPTTPAPSSYSSRAVRTPAPAPDLRAAVSIIVDVTGREILDSRGNPTVEVEIELASGATGRAAVPSGASTGAPRGGRAARRRRALRRQGGRGGRRARRRRDRRGRHRRRGARPAGPRHHAHRARRHRREVAPRRERDPRRVARGREGRGRRVRAPALPLRRRRRTRTCCRSRCMNVLNGGAHADSNVDLQEFMLAPVGAASFAEALRVGRGDVPRAPRHPPRPGPLHRARRRRWLRARPALERRGGEAAPRGDRQAGYTPGDEIAIALDTASTEFFVDGAYRLEGEGKTYTSAEFADYLADLCVPVPDRLDRGRDGRGRLGRLGRAHRARSATGCSSWATTCS